MPLLIAVLHIGEFRGDHEADVQLNYEVNLNEAVGALWERIRADRKGAGVALEDSAFVALHQVKEKRP